MDEVCGGDCWRQAWLDELTDKDAAEAAVVQGYAEKLSKEPGHAGYWVIDVRPRSGLKPLYYLVFASRHISGLEYGPGSRPLQMRRPTAGRGTPFPARRCAFRSRDRRAVARCVSLVSRRTRLRRLDPQGPGHIRGEHASAEGEHETRAGHPSREADQRHEVHDLPPG